jgi:oxygen-independent coproporphyrinogen-3 oxidase
MQTFQDQSLRLLGRSHTVEQSVQTLQIYREQGVKNINIDLILGLPGQTQEEWSHNLVMARELKPDHISMYMLEIHENTYFGKVYGSGQLPAMRTLGLRGIPELLDDDAVESYYFQAVEAFEKAGLRQYEISNFARPGFESRHNLKYWTDMPFLGFGCGAYSYLDGRRWGNERDPARYTELMRQNQDAIVECHTLDGTECEEEALFLGMRLVGGISLQSFREKFGYELRNRFNNNIGHLLSAGLIEMTSHFLKLTPRGRMLSNEVFSEFMH